MSLAYLLYEENLFDVMRDDEDNKDDLGKAD